MEKEDEISQISLVEAFKTYRDEDWAFDYNYQKHPLRDDTTIPTGTPYSFGEIISDRTIWVLLSDLNTGKIVENSPDYSWVKIQLQGEQNRIFIINALEEKIYYNDVFVSNILGYDAETHLIDVDMPLVQRHAFNIYRPYNENFKVGVKSFLPSAIIKFLTEHIFMLTYSMAQDPEESAKISFKATEEFMNFRSRPFQKKVDADDIVKWVIELSKKYPADRFYFQKFLNEFRKTVEYDFNPKPLGSFQLFRPS